MPIVLNKNTIALIHIFTKYDDIEDLWIWDSEGYEKEYWATFEGAAKQFVEQLKGHWTPDFMIRLRGLIDEELQRHDQEFGTKFFNEAQGA